MNWQVDPDSANDYSASAEVMPGIRLSVWPTDEVLETYVSWRETCEQVRIAYAEWRSSERWESDLTFAAYCAALDREESAARFYADCVEQLGARAA
jgi:hypothetical protein